MLKWLKVIRNFSLQLMLLNWVLNLLTLLWICDIGLLRYCFGFDHVLIGILVCLKIRVWLNEFIFHIRALCGGCLLASVTFIVILCWLRFYIICFYTRWLYCFASCPTVLRLWNLHIFAKYNIKVKCIWLN